MTFMLHDTLSDRVIPLPERTAGETSIYVCGPTVYGHIHVGNARGPVVFDVLVRHLRARGRKVIYARNYTDVDDKIIAVAVDNAEPPAAVAERFITAYREEMSALGCLTPTVEPRVSETIGPIVELIKSLVSKGNAYVTPEGDVYYDVATFADYGKLSKRRIEALSAEHGRGKSGEGKRGEHDFALWKSAKPGEPEGARWPSPWGEGRPGWHIECSAMSHQHLGDGFDLHGGGPDLKFPHHENELAQSEPVYGAPMARAWMHHGFIEVDIERSAGFSEEIIGLLPALREREPELRKVSKSDAKKLQALRERGEGLSELDKALVAVLERKVQFGHWFQLRRLRTRVDGEAVRLWLLGTHYRAPLAFDLEGEGETVRFDAIEQAERRLEYFYDTRQKLAARLSAVRTGAGAKPAVGPAGAGEVFQKLREEFTAALDDDLNTPGALDPFARVFAKVNELCDAKRPDPRDLAAAETVLGYVTSVLGVADRDPEDFFARVTTRRVADRGLTMAWVEGEVRARTEARSAREFERADTIRQALLAKGIELRDGSTGTTWRAV